MDGGDEFCDVLVERRAMWAWVTLSGDQQRSWLSWIDDDLAHRGERRREAANRLRDGQPLPPGYGIGHKVMAFCATLLNLA